MQVLSLTNQDHWTEVIVLSDPSTLVLQRLSLARSRQRGRRWENPGRLVAGVRGMSDLRAVTRPVATDSVVLAVLKLAAVPVEEEWDKERDAIKNLPRARPWLTSLVLPSELSVYWPFLVCVFSMWSHEEDTENYGEHYGKRSTMYKENFVSNANMSCEMTTKSQKHITCTET